MDLNAITIREEPGRYESLALALRAAIEAASGEIDYDTLCATLGVSFAAVSVSAESAPGWWMTYGRDAFVEPVAELFGLRLRNLQPPDVGLEMTQAVEFPQHFEASYKPLVQRAIENGQPVLAWQGWPGVSGLFWGVIARAQAETLGGTTLWAEGPRVTMTGPAMQCYVVEDFARREPTPLQVLKTAMQHADAYMNRAPFAPVTAGAGVPAIVTGPAAFDAWERWLSETEFGPIEEDASWREHRQHAEFVMSSWQSAGRFLEAMRPVVPAECRDNLAATIETCGQIVALLDPSAAEAGAREAFDSRAGRERLLAAVHAAEAANRRLALTVEELAREL